MATRELMREAAGAYEANTGMRVIAEAGGGVAVAERIRSGEPYDIVVLARGAIEDLIAHGDLVAGSCVDVAQACIGAAVRAGATRPSIRNEADVMRAVLGARTLSYSTGPSGKHLESVFDAWGILPRIRDRIVVPPPGVPVATLLADGRAELGFQQLSELLTAPGIELLGLLPEPIQSTTVFSAAILRTGTMPDEARRFIVFLASTAMRPAKNRLGLT